MKSMRAVKIRKILLNIIATVCIAGLLIGLGGSIGFAGDMSEENVRPHTFDRDQFKITLTSEFRQTVIKGNYVFEHSDVSVWVSDGIYSRDPVLKQYTLLSYVTKLIKEDGSIPESAEIKYVNNDNGQYVYFEYDYYDPMVNTTFHYCNFIYKKADTFWSIKIAMDKEDQEKYSESAIIWGESFR